MEAPSDRSFWDEFQEVIPADAVNVLGSVRATSELDPCPSWLVKTSRETLGTVLTRVVNVSLRQGRLSPSLEAVVRPLLKKPSLDVDILASYRPISNLPFLEKVIERAVALQLQAHLDSIGFLDPFQSGFRPSYGTETTLVALMDDLHREMDAGCSTFLILLDLLAAFDTVDHGLLLRRLQDMGGSGRDCLGWFRSFLSGRSQRVVLGAETSSPQALTCGVPQGSILSLLLFNAYMQPLGEIVRVFRVRCHQCADDTQLYLSFSTDPGPAVSLLSQCLEAMADWIWQSRLKLNPDKMEVMVVGRVREVLAPLVEGVRPPVAQQVRSLRVVLDSGLCLDRQVELVAKAAFRQLYLVRRLRPYISRPDLATLIHAFITSRLDYCNALYVGLPLFLVRRLQLVQNAAARLLTGTGQWEHITPVLCTLHWLPIAYRARFKVLVLIYKALYGLGPSYCGDHLALRASERSLRSTAGAFLEVPRVKCAATLERAFSVAGPRLWNSFPEEARLAPGLLAFRLIWLFVQAFGGEDGRVG
uniref:Reverse transcriptase domain-containing protein n=1 Tax=Sphenodon punctatus TaxID=8508 RepID=A0A8D0GH51_SPHPU